MKQEAVNPCEECEQRELCPVYMGQSCLLVNQRKLADTEDREKGDEIL